MAGDGSPSERYREALLDAMLSVAAQDGWTSFAMAKARDAAGLSEGQAMIAAPNGVRDLLGALAQRTARAAGSAAERAAADGLKIRERVSVSVLAFIDALEPHKPAVRRASGALASAPLAPSALWAAADAIWTGLGDKSMDANWYSKRAILSGVLGSTLLAWLGTDDRAEVEAFLARRIGDVMSFEKLKADWRAFAEKLPNPLDILGRRPA